MIRLFREFEFRTLIERLPPLHGEAPPAPGDLLREADAGQPIHAVQVDAARRPQGWGEGSAAARRAAAPARPLVGEGSGLQLTLDFDAIGGGGAAATAAVAVAPTIEVAAGDPRGALVAALADPGRVEVVDAAGARTLVAWLAAQPGLTVASVSDDPRPRRGRLLALAVAGADGRAIAAADEAAPSLLDAAVASGRPLLGHEVKRVLVAHLAAVDPDGRLRPHAAALPAVAFDTQIAAYLLNAALRSQTLGDIAAERLGLEISGIEALAPGPRAGVAALAAEFLKRIFTPTYGYGSGFASSVLAKFWFTSINSIFSQIVGMGAGIFIVLFSVFLGGLGAEYGASGFEQMPAAFLGSVLTGFIFWAILIPVCVFAGLALGKKFRIFA